VRSKDPCIATDGSRSGVEKQLPAQEMCVAMNLLFVSLTRGKRCRGKRCVWNISSASGQRGIGPSPSESPMESCGYIDCSRLFMFLPTP